MTMRTKREFFQHYFLKLRMQHLTNANTSPSTPSSVEKECYFFISFFLYFIYISQIAEFQRTTSALVACLTQGKRD